VEGVRNHVPTQVMAQDQLPHHALQDRVGHDLGRGLLDFLALLVLEVLEDPAQSRGAGRLGHRVGRNTRRSWLPPTK
jgi:hypothetical protein